MTRRRNIQSIEIPDSSFLPEADKTKSAISVDYSHADIEENQQVMISGRLKLSVFLFSRPQSNLLSPISNNMSRQLSEQVNAQLFSRSCGIWQSQACKIHNPIRPLFIKTSVENYINRIVTTIKIKLIEGAPNSRDL